LASNAMKNVLCMLTIIVLLCFGFMFSGCEQPGAGEQAEYSRNLLDTGPGGIFFVGTFARDLWTGADF
jgi:hypothetical protein